MDWLLGHSRFFIPVRYSICNNGLKILESKDLATLLDIWRQAWNYFEPHGHPVWADRATRFMQHQGKLLTLPGRNSTWQIDVNIACLNWGLFGSFWYGFKAAVVNKHFPLARRSWAIENAFDGIKECLRGEWVHGAPAGMWFSREYGTGAHFLSLHSKQRNYLGKDLNRLPIGLDTYMVPRKDLFGASCKDILARRPPLPSYVLIPPQQWSSNHSGHDLLDWPSLDYDFATAYSMTLHENLHFTDPEAMCGWLRHLPRRLQEGLCFPKSLVPEESSLGYDAIWGELVWGSGPFKFAALCQDSLSKSAFFPRKARPYCLLTPPWDVNWSNRHW